MFNFYCLQKDWTYAVKLLKTTPKSYLTISVSSDGFSITNRGKTYVVPVRDFTGEPATFRWKGIQIQAIHTFPTKELAFTYDGTFMTINTTKFRA